MAVARLASGQEHIATFLKVLRGGIERVRFPSRRAGDGVTQRRTSDDRLKPGRLVRGAEPLVDYKNRTDRHDDQYD